MTDATDAGANGNELSVTRLIQAPPEVVWRVWTQRTGEWFTPPPWRTTGVDFDLRPGGHSRLVMEGPDGERVPSEGVFLEVVPNRLIVSTDAYGPGWVPKEAFMTMVVRFEPEGEGTRYTASARHWNEEARSRHEAMGFHEGWGTVADQLAALAEAEARGA